MDPVCWPVMLGGVGLLVALGVGFVVLLKLGVIVKYATKEEPQDQGDYHLDQSREPDNK